MQRQEAIAQIKDACAALSRDLMKLNPPISALPVEARDELFQSVYRITKDVELIKKRIIQLEKNEDTPEL